MITENFFEFVDKAENPVSGIYSGYPYSSQKVKKLTHTFKTFIKTGIIDRECHIEIPSMYAYRVLFKILNKDLIPVLFLEYTQKENRIRLYKAKYEEFTGMEICFEGSINDLKKYLKYNKLSLRGLFGIKSAPVIKEKDEYSEFITFDFLKRL